MPIVIFKVKGSTSQKLLRLPLSPNTSLESDTPLGHNLHQYTIATVTMTDEDWRPVQVPLHGQNGGGHAYRDACQHQVELRL